MTGRSHTRAEAARERATAPAVYTPPAGLPADPTELLAYLQAGVVTPEQLAYLRSNALAQYKAGLAAARLNPDLAAVVALGDQILTAWGEILAANPPDPLQLPANPFNP